MSTDSTLSAIEAIFRDVMDNEDIKLSPEVTADDIYEWDSLTHIQMIVEVEKQFKTKFTSVQIQGFKNVGDLVSAVDAN